VWIGRGLNRSSKKFEPFLYLKKVLETMSNNLADWWWQSEEGQICWFSPRFPELF